jgi:hypothetical protein
MMAAMGMKTAMRMNRNRAVHLLLITSLRACPLTSQGRRKAKGGAKPHPYAGLELIARCSYEFAVYLQSNKRYYKQGTMQAKGRGKPRPYAAQWSFANSY